MKPKISDITTAVCSVFRVEHQKVLGPSPAREAAHPRQYIMFLARELTGMSYPCIAEEFAMHHTNIMFGCRQVARRLRRFPELAPKIELCRAHIAALTQARELNWAAAIYKPLVMEAAE